MMIAACCEPTRVIFRWVSVIAGEFDAAERLNG
jgi:hypothetical protein